MKGEIKFAGKYTEIKVYVDNYCCCYSGDSSYTAYTLV